MKHTQRSSSLDTLALIHPNAAGLEGLKPESHSECVKFSGGQRRVSDPLVDSRFQLVKTLPERRVVRHEVGLDV